MSLKDPVIVASIARIIARELGVGEGQVAATLQLIDEGASIPFIARYRKERTGGLDDTQLRTLAERYDYLTVLSERRDVVLRSIREQGKLTPDLEQQIRAALTKVELEDLYAPYRPRRRTKASIAREAGLEPLADRLLRDPALDPLTEALRYVDASRGVEDADSALEGARSILIERIAEAPSVVGPLREKVWVNGQIASSIVRGKETEGAKYADYFDFAENISNMPSHRALALLRGEKEGVLKINLDIPHDPNQRHPALTALMSAFGIQERNRPADRWLADTARLAWKQRLAPSSQSDLVDRLKEKSDAEAIRVFSRNVKDLLMAAPAGPRVVMGIDPGIRTGCKIAVVDGTGKLLETTTIYPHEPRKDWTGSLISLGAMVRRLQVELIAIGNGTASRETDRLVGELCEKLPEMGITRVTVSEAGASVYSASELAAKEFPDLDVSLRGAVSIARRLQDPLAELVKIEPKAIGVGQYQHDVDQNALTRSLGGVVEDCVNAVGVDVNTASAALLSHVSGLNAAVAANIVAWRDQNGRFDSRMQLKKVPRMGPKAFEQAAGFLRIMDGVHPLDASAVHPEAYPVAERIAEKSGRPLKALIGDKAFLSMLKPEAFASEQFGVPTVTDILAELIKPGRDPRPAFRTAAFRDGVEKISDLSPGMKLEGTVTNVTAFGAFVDIGVHQDGLVHISELSDSFVRDPHAVVKAGDVVTVRVKDVDTERKRIALSMKREQSRAGEKAPAQGKDRSIKPGAHSYSSGSPGTDERDSPFAALRNLKLNDRS